MDFSDRSISRVGMAAPVDALFEAIITELEEALDLAISRDRGGQLTALARHAERLQVLTAAALILAGEEPSPTQQNPLD